MRTLLLLLLALLLGACASPGPTVRTHESPEADFGRYRTFAFYSPLDTDRAGYTSLISQYLKHATREALEARGYRYDEAHPDLLVNFRAWARNRVDVIPAPAYMGMGYYGSRYGVWGAYSPNVVRYREGRLGIDLVDARANQLVWEGSAEGTMSEAARTELEATLGAAVREIFLRFPYRGDDPAPEPGRQGN